MSRPPRLTDTAQAFIEPALGPGQLALDATAGTGQDTLFLARGVGPTGRVHAFDIQAEALRRAGQRIAEAGLAERVTWHHASHADLGDCVGDARFAAIMFNLGWLPGGDRGVITRPETTLAGLARAAERLVSGGRLAVVVYRGHPGGDEEHAAVAQWAHDDGHGLRLEQAHAAKAGRAPGPVFFGLRRGPGRERP